MSTSLVQQSWKLICDMEKHVTPLDDVLSALALVALSPDMEETEAAVVQRLAWIARDYLKELEEVRKQIFHLNHPAGQERAQ